MLNSKIIDETLFQPASFAPQDLQKMFYQHLSQHIDFADIYLQNSFSESWVLEDSQVKRGSYAIERGAGIRFIHGEKTGFSYCDDIHLASIQQAITAAKSIAKLGKDSKAIQILAPSYPCLYSSNNPLESMDSLDKIKLLHMIDDYCRQLDPRIKQVSASLAADYDVISIINSEGLIAGDVRPLVSVRISIWVEQAGRRECASAGGGGRFDYHELKKNRFIQDLADKALHEALTSLESLAAPAGQMPVVLGAGWPGILLHEAVGHGLEGDFNRKNLSAFSGKIGQKVASEKVTVVDNGSLANRRGSLNIDDEGTPSQNTTLIENGVLVNYMQDKLNARLMGMTSTGNCRRQSYAHLPMPRMTNTYMLNGQDNKEDMIASIKKGIYAANFSGGQVDITSGQFVFTLSEAYMIEHGKITHPIKGATLIGNGPEVMKKVSMVANDLALDLGIGTCGKDGQSVPVGVGQPSLKIDEIVVGGTKA